MTFRILYRGSLSSCNYGCEYCPFAKHTETAAEHQADGVALNRFVDWVATKPIAQQLGILFTPWGEALFHKRYQDAFIRLSNFAHVDKVAIQTNLATRFEWLNECDVSKVAFWATYHPTEVTQERFLAQVAQARSYGAAVSVGVVGLKEHQTEITQLRQALPDDVYMWINAYKRVENYYSPALFDRFKQIDPLFPYNTMRHPSLGQWCQAGETVVSIDGNGDMRRCHFIREPLANIYADDWQSALQPRRCTNATCGCHIGYVHMPQLQQAKIYGDQILERIPVLSKSDLPQDIPVVSQYVAND